MDKTLLGRRIKEARIAHDYTLDDLANAIGVNKSTVSRYERGEIEKPKLPVIESIANELRVNAAWLIGKTDDMSIRHALAVSKPSEIVLTIEEQALITKYRALDDRGRSAVLNVLNHEYESLPGEKAGAPAKEA